jgi:hypothetical protein
MFDSKVPCAFIDGAEPEDEFTSNLAEKVKEIKENKEIGRHSYEII